MKNNFYLCLLASVLLSINLSCSKEDMFKEQESLSLEKSVSNLENDKSVSSNTDLEEKPLDYQLNVQANTTDIPTEFDEEVYTLYLNMDLLEQEYLNDPVNPNFSGPFNLFYRNLMASHFTIYQISESSNFTCGNIERWIVNLDELNTYLITLGISEVANDEDQGIGGHTSGDDTSDSSTTTGKNKTFKKPPNDDDEDDDEVPQWLEGYSNCF